MVDRMLDTSIHRSANEAWYVSGRASQQDRYGRSLSLLKPHLQSAGLVYDLGAGTGHFAALLTATAEKVVGIEKLPERVKLCRSSHIDNTRLHFIEGDFLQLEIPEGQANAVCALEMLYYIDREDWPGFLEKIYHALMPGGLLLTSLNVFTREGTAGEKRLLAAIEEHFEILEIQHMHRMYYYRLELPLIRLLDEITYLKSVKVFYPHTISVGHVVYSTWLDRILLPPNSVIDRLLLPVTKKAALALLGSKWLYGAVTWLSRQLAPDASRSQSIILARRLPSTPSASGRKHDSDH
jgi:SAM-dependent methyltransferase